MSFRTLKFGDRTISYDAGLNLAQNEDLPSRQNKLISVDPQYDDDGIGTSDDETNSNTSNPKTADELADLETAQASVECDLNDNLKIDCDNLSNGKKLDLKLKERRVIKPDLTALNRLLAFDEEEEDDCDGESDTASDDESPTKIKLKSSHNSGWHKTIARDLAKLTSSRNANSPNSPNRREALARRHSITICESRRRRKNSNSANQRSHIGGASPKLPISSGPMSMQPHLPVSAQSSDASSLESNLSSSRESPSRNDECSLNVNNIRLSSEVPETDDDNYNSGKAGLQTLNLRLDEVAHIRAALTKAELEAIDSNVREDIEKGKVCFLCMKTRFGLFSRGNNCEMCKQLVCAKCQSKMRIPLEHFSTTPVFALSPSAMNEDSKRSGSIMNDPSSKYQSLAPPSTCKDKKISLPDSLGLLMTNSLQSVGSAPNSPRLSRHLGRAGYSQSGLPTISGVVGFANSNSNHEPVSLPSTAAMITKSPYATLPKKTRRASWMSPMESEREKLEGLPLTVCNDCKDMVVQVIRVSRSTRRLQMARSAFFSLTPDTFREQRI